MEIATSIAEVAFHRKKFLADARILDRLTFAYVDFPADFHGTFHHLDNKEMNSSLRPDPVPECYQVSQSLANRLLYAGSNGIVYPSVRRPSGTCIACFRPALVFNVRQGREYQITLGPNRFNLDRLRSLGRWSNAGEQARPIYGQLRAWPKRYPMLPHAKHVFRPIFDRSGRSAKYGNMHFSVNLAIMRVWEYLHPHGEVRPDLGAH